MKINNKNISGLQLITFPHSSDSRGWFFKVYNTTLFKKHGISMDVREVYFSNSSKNTIRGMHFQIPPDDHEKIVFVLRGEIIDVILDLRKKSPTFKEFLSLKLSEKEGKVLFIPRGCAHGFKSLKDNTIVGYLVSSEYSPSKDQGIRFDSFGFDWKIANPVISSRDLKFPALKDFKSPF